MVSEAAATEDTVDCTVERWPFALPDGASLRVTRYDPQSAARGTFVVLHGFGEFTEKYELCTARLRRLGFAVLTFDWRSQGLSSRYPESQRRGYVRDFDVLLDDLEALLDSDRCKALPQPLWLLGHSMGGMLALRMVERLQSQGDWQQSWAGCVLSAPMLGIYRLPRWFISTVARLQLWRGKAADFAWGAGELDPKTAENRITSDSARFAEIMAMLEAEPDLRTHGATWGWLAAAARLMRGSVRRRRLRGYAMPMLLLSPGEDVIVDADLHRKFAARCAACEYLYLPESRHEPLQETPAIQDAVYAALGAFVDRVEAGRRASSTSRAE